MIPTTGYLHIIHGPMMSSKTTTLISVVQKLSVLGRRVLVLNHMLDSRSTSDVIRTHTGSCLPAHKVSSLGSVVDMDSYDVIAVDEAQFFEDLVPTVLSWLKLQKYVVVAGLISDAHQRKFGHLLELMPVADKIQSLTAFCNLCNDGTPGPFTVFKDERCHPVQLSVGGTETYRAVCRKHLTLKASTALC